MMRMLRKIWFVLTAIPWAVGEVFRISWEMHRVDKTISKAWRQAEAEADAEKELSE